MRSHHVTKSQCHKLREIRSLFLLVTWCLGALVTQVFALDLDKVKTYLLSGDYKAAITEGEKILATAKESSRLDELYYILGLSYLKDGNYLRASDIFEIILREFKHSPFKEEAMLGLGDTYFLRGDYTSAQTHYRNIIGANNHSKILPCVYERLSQCALKSGDMELAKEYAHKLNQELPLSTEKNYSKGAYEIPADFYTVQVGSFTKASNANNLVQKLSQKSYEAYIEEGALEGKTVYRVKVGKLKSRQGAQELEQRLSQEGYPTKVFP